MKNFKYYGEVALALIAVVCIIVALCGPQGQDIFTVISSLFVGAGNCIRGMSSGGNTVGGWILYIFIGIIPLIFPLVKTILRRKVYVGSLLWGILCVYTFIMMYLLVNPHLLRSEAISVSEEWNAVYLDTVKHGACIIWYALALLCVLFECAGLLIKRSNSSYIFALIIMYVLAAVYVISAFYGEVADAVSIISSVSGTTLVNISINVFAAVLSAAMGIVPTVTTVILLCVCASFVCALRRDNLSPRLIGYIDRVAKLSKISIVVTLICAIANNVVQLALSKWLLNVSFSLMIPLSSLLVVCLVLITAGVLKRAIAANEENKLVI